MRMKQASTSIYHAINISSSCIWDVKPRWRMIWSVGRGLTVICGSVQRPTDELDKLSSTTTHNSLSTKRLMLLRVIKRHRPLCLCLSVCPLSLSARILTSLAHLGTLLFSGLQRFGLKRQWYKYQVAKVIWQRPHRTSLSWGMRTPI